MAMDVAANQEEGLVILRNMFTNGCGPDERTTCGAFWPCPCLGEPVAEEGGQWRVPVKILLVAGLFDV